MYILPGMFPQTEDWLNNPVGTHSHLLPTWLLHSAETTQKSTFASRKWIHYWKFYKMFIEKQERTVRTLYNQWGVWTHFLSKNKAPEAVVTHTSSFTVSLTCRGRFWHYLSKSGATPMKEEIAYKCSFSLGCDCLVKGNHAGTTSVCTCTSELHNVKIGTWQVHKGRKSPSDYNWTF